MKIRIFFTFLLLVGFSASNGFVQTPTADLILTSNVKGCRILVNADSTSEQTPAFFKGLPVGTHLITLIDAYGKKLEDKVTVEAGKMNNFHLNFNVGDLELSSNLPVDSIFVNDVRIYQQLPAALTNMPEGDYTITFIESRGQRVKQKIFLKAGESNKIAVDFPLANLHVQSNLKGAAIRLSGKATDQKAPATFKGLAEGIYHVQVEYKGKILRDRVSVTAGKDNLINLVYKKSKTWKYIAGAASLVGGGTIYFLTKGAAKDEPGIPNPPPVPTSK